MCSPPLTVRPKTAEARLAEKEAAILAATPPKAPRPPRPLLPPMKEIDSSFVQCASKPEVWTLAATDYVLSNSYDEMNQVVRNAKPNNWRRNKEAAAADSAEKEDAARSLLSTISTVGKGQEPRDGEPNQGEVDGPGSRAGDTGNTGSGSDTIQHTRKPKKGAGENTLAPRPACPVTRDSCRSSSRGTVGTATSSRNIWQGCKDPSFAPNVPRCASALHRLTRPHTADSYNPRASSRSRATSKLSAQGPKVYKRPESASSYAARNLGGVESLTKQYVLQKPTVAKPPPPPGLKDFYSALATMNRDIVER